MKHSHTSLVCGMRPRVLPIISLTGAMLFAQIRPVHAQSLSWICGYCQMSVGAGETYHFWARTGGIVVPLTLTWNRDTWELAALRFTTRQELEYRDRRPDRLVARPYWGLSVTRRIGLFGPPAARIFVGIGASYKTETDQLNSSRWNIAGQLGVRFRLRHGGSSLEICLRHWSNGGLRLPNHGQDFFTLSYVF